MMARSKATRSFGAYKVVVVTLAASNQPFSLLIKCRRSYNSCFAISRSGSSSAIGQIYSSYDDGDSCPPPIIQTKAFPDFHALQVNLGVQGANEPLNNMFNIVRK